MKIKTINQWVLIEPLPENEVKINGIIIPAFVKDNPFIQRGIVRSIPSKVKEKYGYDVDFKEGDIVIFSKGTENTIEISGKKMIFTRIFDVITVLGDAYELPEFK